MYSLIPSAFSSLVVAFNTAYRKASARKSDEPLATKGLILILQCFSSCFSKTVLPAPSSPISKCRESPKRTFCSSAARVLCVSESARGDRSSCSRKGCFVRLNSSRVSLCNSVSVCTSLTAIWIRSVVRRLLEQTAGASGEQYWQIIKIQPVTPFQCSRHRVQLDR